MEPDPVSLRVSGQVPRLSRFVSCLTRLSILRQGLDAHNAPTWSWTRRGEIWIVARWFEMLARHLKKSKPAQADS